MADQSYSSGDVSPEREDAGASTPEEMEQKPAERSDEDILAESLERFRLTEEAESEIRQKQLEDLKFAAGDQWEADVINARKIDRRPCFTVNRLPQHIKQVTNDQRQNRPSIKVHPVDDQADIETAKIYSGVIRNIEYSSSADVAYDTAHDSAVRGGRGFWRVNAKYVSPLSFDQELVIEAIPNPLAVFFDPYSKKPDGSDANYAHIIEDISKDEFCRQYPKSKLATSGAFTTTGNTPPSWMGDRGVRIAEYYCKEYQDATLLLLSNGQSVLEHDLEDEARVMLAAQGVKIVNSRPTQIPSVKWYKHTATEILDRTDWLGSFIPVIPNYGETLDIDGKKELKGIVRDAKDSQRLLNYMKSAVAETIALAPKAPWIAEERQISAYKDDWESANNRNYSVLLYSSTDESGQPINAPPPQRQVFEPAIQGTMLAARDANDDVKSSTGVQDSTLGIAGNETSGIAIQRRNNQSQTSNFHFTDNLTRSQRHTGRIIIELIPKIYDTARVARIMGEDGSPEIVKLNQEWEHNGKVVNYDLSKGKYDCTVDVGPSFASRRQEAAASQMDFVRAVPAVGAVTADLIAKNQDWPGAQEFADRLKKLPQIAPLIDDPKNKGQQIPPQIKAQLQQQGQMLEQVTKELHEAQDTIAKDLLKLQSVERMKMAELETNATVELAKLESKEAITGLTHAHEQLLRQVAELDARTRQIGFDQPFDDDGSTGSGAPEQFAPGPAGAPGANGGPGAMNPTGGASPGSITEQGVPANDDPNAN